ncbi:MAG: hypothetical protein ABIQ18_40035 [Umezawaea sp.]
MICPTSYHLAIYRSVLDFQTGRWSHEETYEYHYADVVAVTTTRRPAPYLELRADDPLGNRKIAVSAPSVLTFQISVSSNETCAVTVGIWDDDDRDAHAPLRESGIDPVIDSVRPGAPRQEGRHGGRVLTGPLVPRSDQLYPNGATCEFSMNSA